MDNNGYVYTPLVISDKRQNFFQPWCQITMNNKTNQKTRKLKLMLCWRIFDLITNHLHPINVLVTGTMIQLLMVNRSLDLCFGSRSCWRFLLIFSLLADTWRFLHWNKLLIRSTFIEKATVLAQEKASLILDANTTMLHREYDVLLVMCFLCTAIHFGIMNSLHTGLSDHITSCHTI